MRVYYSLAVEQFKPILSAGWRFHSRFSGGLRLTNYRAVAGNHLLSLTKDCLLGLEQVSQGLQKTFEPILKCQVTFPTLGARLRMRCLPPKVREISRHFKFTI